MQPKVLLAFAGGVVIASGVFLWMGRDTPEPQPESPAPVAEVVEAIPTPPVVEKPVPAPAPAQRVVVKRRPRTFRPAQTTAPADRPPIDLPPPDLPPAPEVTPVEAPTVEAPVDAVVAQASELPAPPLQTVTLQPDTVISVILEEPLSSDRNQAGDAFRASLDQPLVIDGWAIAERGARVIGRIRDIGESGRVRGIASMTLELSKLTASDGQTIDLRTQGFVHKARTSKKNDAVKVGIGAAIGAALGAAIGGGKGAAIGAASGGAAGAGAVVATRGDAAVLEAETRIPFRVDRAVEITERR